METSLKPPGGDGGDAESIEEDVLNIVRLKYLDNIASFRQIRVVKKKLFIHSKLDRWRRLNLHNITCPTL